MRIGVCFTQCLEKLGLQNRTYLRGGQLWSSPAASGSFRLLLCLLFSFSSLIHLQLWLIPSNLHTVSHSTGLAMPSIYISSYSSQQRLPPPPLLHPPQLIVSQYWRDGTDRCRSELHKRTVQVGKAA